MTRGILDLIAKHHEAIVKEAVAGAALRLGGMLMRGVGGLGKTVMKRPRTAAGAAIGAASTAHDLSSGTQRFTNILNKNRQNPFQPPVV